MILKNNSKEFSSEFLVPDRGYQFDGDVSMLLGHAFIKNSKKAPIKFNEQAATDYIKNDINVPNDTLMTLIKNDLVQYDTYDHYLAVNWTKTKDNSLEPTGVYIATGFPSNTYIKASSRSGVYLRYINPLIDVWSRQRNQPTIINVTLMPNFNNKTKLEKRGYQTNLIMNNSGSMHYVDFLPAAFDAYYAQDTQTAIKIVNSLGKMLINEPDPIEKNLKQLCFKFITLQFFEANSKKYNQLMQNSNNYSGFDLAKKQEALRNKVTLANLIQFIDNALTPKHSPKYISNLIEKYNINNGFSYDTNYSVSTWQMLLICQPNNQYVKLMRQFSSNVALLQKMLAELLDSIKQFVNQSLIDFDHAIKIDPVNLAIGQTVKLQIDKKYNNAIMKLLGKDDYGHKVSAESSVDQNGYVCFDLNEFNLNYDLELPSVNGLKFNLAKPLPQSLKLIKLTHTYQPLYLEFYATYFMLANKYVTTLATKYVTTLIDLLYTTVISLSLLNNLNGRPFANFKYIIDLRNKAFDQPTDDQLALWLTSGLGQKMQFTIIGNDQCIKPNLQDIFKANAHMIEIKPQTFKVIGKTHMEYPGFNKMPIWFNHQYVYHFDKVPEIKVRQHTLKEIITNMQNDLLKN